ncbi:hypothetical protein DPMN_129496 [Dreissena polymorpha]|uniref:Uncharacterized protein n=1 Tax=Dreissena polymorpha TaxID=45954 RepID=A0A9D4H1A2_DREPO|nr:hypothetical protein DPMN_129496 [Dreissena polymorpha]
MISGDSQMFSPTFSTLDPASLDPNYHASLTLDCGQFGSIVMYAGVFANMSYIEKLKVIMEPTS